LQKIEFIGPDHYHIALSLCNNYCKTSSMWWGSVQEH